MRASETSSFMHLTKPRIDLYDGLYFMVPARKSLLLNLLLFMADTIVRSVILITGKPVIADTETHRSFCRHFL